MTIIIDDYIKNGDLIKTPDGYKIKPDSAEKIVDELEGIDETYHSIYGVYLFSK